LECSHAHILWDNCNFNWLSRIRYMNRTHNCNNNSCNYLVPIM
jgi:hypothetical protein